MAKSKSAKKKSRASRDGPADIPAKRGHHHVYVVYLRNPRGDGKAGYYVGMTGLSPEQRFDNHKQGIKAGRVVRKHGVFLVPRLYEHLNPMPYAKALERAAKPDASKIVQAVKRVAHVEA